MADEPKIHIDSDWKAQAQAEREKLRESEQKKKAEEGVQSPQPSGGQPGEAGPSDEGMGEEGREMPPANFETLMQTMASNALLAMGAVPDPETGQRYAHMGLAKHHIDMLGVLQEKTKGNLSERRSRRSRPRCTSFAMRLSSWRSRPGRCRCRASRGRDPAGAGRGGRRRPATRAGHAGTGRAGAGWAVAGLNAAAAAFA